MITYANAEDILTSCFLQRWADTTPVSLKNSIPKELDDSVQEWVHFTARINASSQTSIGAVGNRRYTRVGRIAVDIFVKAGTLTGAQTDLVKKVVDMYEDGSWSKVQIHQILQHDLPDGAHRRASITGDGRWYGTQINIQFSFDEVK